MQNNVAAMSMVLQQTLQGLCCGTAWNYAVFWKVKRTTRTVLIWEDGFHEFAGPKAFGGKSGSTLDVDHQTLATSVAKMSYHVYSFGEGLIGRVSFTAKHQWVFAPNDRCVANHLPAQRVPGRQTLFEKYPAGWQQQFDAGIKTIAVVAVPGGVVQLGSLQLMMEDLKLVSHMRSIFQTLECMPGAFLSDLVNNVPTAPGCVQAPFSPRGPTPLPVPGRINSHLLPAPQGNGSQVLPQTQPMMLPPRVSLSELTKHPPSKQLLGSTAMQQMSQGRVGVTGEGFSMSNQASLQGLGLVWPPSNVGAQTHGLNQPAGPLNNMRVPLQSLSRRDEQYPQGADIVAASRGVNGKAALASTMCIGNTNGAIGAPFKDSLYPPTALEVPKRCASAGRRSRSRAIDQIALNVFSSDTPWGQCLPEAQGPSLQTSPQVVPMAPPVLPPAAPPQLALPVTSFMTGQGPIGRQLRRKPPVEHPLPQSFPVSLPGPNPGIVQPGATAMKPLPNGDALGRPFPELSVSVSAPFSTELGNESWTSPLEMATMGDLEALGGLGHGLSEDQLLASLMQESSNSGANNTWLTDEMLKRQFCLQDLKDLTAPLEGPADVLGGINNIFGGNYGNVGTAHAQANLLVGGRSVSLLEEADILSSLHLPGFVGGPSQSPLVNIMDGNRGLQMGELGELGTTLSQAPITEASKRPWDMYMTAKDALPSGELAEALGTGLTGQRLQRAQGAPNVFSEDLSFLLKDSFVSAAESLSEQGRGQLSANRHAVASGCQVQAGQSGRVEDLLSDGTRLDLASLEQQATQEVLLRSAGFLPPLNMPAAKSEERGDGVISPPSVGQPLPAPVNVQAFSAVQNAQSQMIEQRDKHVGDGEPSLIEKIVSANMESLSDLKTPLGAGSSEAELGAKGAKKAGTLTPRVKKHAPALMSPAGKCASKKVEAKQEVQESETTKGKKRVRGKCSEGSRPRPRDRQQIQDRVADLRNLVPDSQKLSIDNLFEKTIQHLKYLQGAVQQRQCFKEVEGGSGLSKRRCLEDALENSNGLDPFSVETLPHMPNHMAIEVLCESQELPLELLDTLHRMNLVVKTGAMESRDGKLWARYIVEATREVQKMDVMWQLMHIVKGNLDMPPGTGGQSPAGSAILPANHFAVSQA